MKLILVGLGSFGSSWYRRLKSDYPDLDVAVVDANPERAALLGDSDDPFYTSVTDAIESERPNFLLNATPPQVHAAVNHTAFDHRLPVLCEKPISDDYEDAVWTVARAETEGIPFMVAENYRRAPAMRRVKELIDGGAIGTLTAMHCDLYQPYYTEKPYFVQMTHPLLADVVVHHLDLMRHLTGSEGRRIYAHGYSPQGSWHPGNVALDLVLEMEGGVRATLVGSLVTGGAETGWPGHWRIEGTDGTIAVAGDEIQVSVGGVPSQTFADVSSDRSCGPLDDFLLLLDGKEGIESTGTDYIKTQALVYYAKQSCDCNQAIDIQLPQACETGNWREEEMFRTTRYQGAIVRGHCILLIQHRHHEDGRSYWLIPGGGRAPRETYEQVVRREMLEETHLDVRVERLLLEDHVPRRGIYSRYRTYLCTPVGGEAQPGYEPEEDAAAAYGIVAVAWFDLRDPSSWDPMVREDAITFPLLQRIRAALGYIPEAEAGEMDNHGWGPFAGSV